ncbi:MAG: cell wall-binding protein [Stomatobaculum sp.]|nr:cell wall-binding protein [Stomatobaculum sp.]
MTNRKEFAALFVSAAMILGMAGIANAATYDDPITSVDVNLEYELTSSMTAGDIEVNSDTDGVDAITVSSISNVAYGKRPTVTLKIKADTGSGYYFDSDDAAELKKESAFNFSGDEAEYKSSKRTSNSALTLVVRLPKIGSTNEGGLDIEEISWVDDTGVVEWSEAEDASRYSVKLLRGSSTKTTVSTTDTSYDFSSLIRQYGTGSYTVKVKAYNGSYSSDEWTESDELDVDSDNIKDITGGATGKSSSYNIYSSIGSSSGAWLRDSIGWWYCNADRSYTTNDWQLIDGRWYHFNASGYMDTGWFQSPVSGYWYYLDPVQGHMVTNQYIGSYYVNADGVWVA